MELQWQSPEPGKKWEQEEDQEKAGPEDQDGLHVKKVGALLELTKGLTHKIGIGEGALNLAGGNITGVYENDFGKVVQSRARLQEWRGGGGLEGKMEEFPSEKAVISGVLESKGSFLILEFNMVET